MCGKFVWAKFRYIASGLWCSKLICCRADFISCFQVAFNDKAFKLHFYMAGVDELHKDKAFKFSKKNHQAFFSFFINWKFNFTVCSGNFSPGILPSIYKDKNNRSSFPRISPSHFLTTQFIAPLPVGLLEQAKVISRCPNKHLDQGCTTQILWRAKIFFDLYKCQIWYVLSHSKGVFTKERCKINQIWGFAGQIKSFRGPYVVHAWSRP
jgi:hypothetical protein